MKDSLTYSDNLIKAGVPRTQAEAQVKVWLQMSTDHFVGKEDLKDFGIELAKNLREEIKEDRKVTLICVGIPLWGCLIGVFASFAAIYIQLLQLIQTMTAH